MEKKGLQLIKRENNEFGLEPSFFQIDGKQNKMLGSMIWCHVFPEEPETDQPPLLYYRSFGEMMTVPTSGLIRYGSTPGLFQEPQPEIERMTPPGIPLIYRTVEGDPEGKCDDKYTYEVRMADGSDDFLCRFSTKYIHVKEGDFLDMTGEWLPDTLISYEDAMLKMPYLVSYAIFHGTFRGKPAIAVGGMDRGYPDPTKVQDMLKMDLFAGLGFCSLNKDNTREWGLVYWTKEQGMAWYGKDGQETFVSKNVTVEDLVWEDVPYLNDGTVTFTRATFKVPGTDFVLHYNAKYGRRGQGAVPDDTPGQIQSTGDWYIGDEPCERQYSFGFGESIGAFANDHLDAYGEKHTEE